MQGEAEGVIPAKTSYARDWYREQASEIRSVNEKSINASSLVTTTTFPGFLYFFGYSPKYAQDLPYYDRFPAVFIIEKMEDGFLGLNLHYLDLIYRAKLMDALYNITNNKKYDQTTKLNLTYKLLKSASKYKYYAPCLKKYLYEHVMSKYFMIPAQKWDVALFLPFERFQKATKQKVFRDSRNIIARK